MAKENETPKKKLGLVPRLIIAIVLGILIGQYAPVFISQTIITLSNFVSIFIKFVIPLMILAFVTMGIADISQGAGRLLLVTVVIAYGSTLIAGTGSFLVSSSLFPSFISSNDIQAIADTADKSLSPFFSLALPPLLDSISAVVFAFILGLCISNMRGHEIGDAIYNVMAEFSKIIEKVLNQIIIPLLPLYIAGTFINMTYSGQTFTILGILWKVFLVVIIMHWIYIAAQFLIAGSLTKKNPITMLRNQIPGYVTALGTQSSAATIPVNLQCAEHNGVSKEIRNFVIPLCANIHMCGSMITIVACGTAVCLMNNIPISLGTIVPFILTLGIAMVASPGAPGGSIMTALPFLYLIFGAEAGSPEGPIAALMVALYITQDSFGTACNVSGDNAIAVVIDQYNERKILNHR